MIELQYRTINDTKFQGSLHKLARFDGFSIKTAYQVGKLCEKIGKETQAAREVYLKIIEKYGKKKEDGQGYEPSPAAPYFQLKEGAVLGDVTKEIEEVLDIKTTVDRDKLTFDAIEKVGFTPEEVLALEPILVLE